MVATAMFYGEDQSDLAEDIAASLITSLVGTLPQAVIKHLFLTTKPRTKDSSKKLLNRTSNNVLEETKDYQRIMEARKV